MQVLSYAERQAAFQKAAQNATKNAKQKQSANTSPNKHLKKIKDKLQELGYNILDEKALEEIIGTDTDLKYEKISLLSEKGIISLNEQELDNSKPKTPVVIRISEADVPQEDKKEKENKKERQEETLSRAHNLQEGKEGKSKSQKEPNKDIEFETKYRQSLEKWCQKTTDKKTKQIKREVKSVKKAHTPEEETQIEITPLSPIARKRGDFGAFYKIKKSVKKDQIDVTLGSLEEGKPLNYDYFYALVKAAHDSGADTIEFNNIKTPEFRDKLLAAALQFKMKLKNPPGVINLEAKHLQSIPPGCKHYLELHNERTKTTLKEKGRQILPSQTKTR